MRFLEELIPLRLYSNKKKVYVPVNEKDKKHGSAIFLMGTSQEQNEKMMNAPFIHCPQNLFRSYYIDRNVMTYINGDSDTTDDIEEELDEIEEAALSEGMLHDTKIKFVFENVSTMDERILKKYFNDDSLKKVLKMLRLKESPLDSYIIVCHSNLHHLQSSYNGKLGGNSIYSFNHKGEIHILSNLVYDEESMDGPYGIYCLHELIGCVINNSYPNIDKKLTIWISMALSGQIEYLREKKDKEEFKYSDSNSENINGLYMADVIYQVYNQKGSAGINKILHGDLSDLRKVVSSRVLRDTKKLFNVNIKESAENISTINDPRFEYADEGYLFAGEYSKDYLDILKILEDFDKEEFDRISFYPVYRDSKWIKKRIVLRDSKNIPMSFMDIYHFPIDPERALITTAVSKYYRGHHLCSVMFEKLINSGFALENGIKKYIWHVHPGNDRSENIAKLLGFEKKSDELDKYGRYTYVYNLENNKDSKPDIKIPELNSDEGYKFNESSILVFNEFDSSYDSMIKRYLYKERLRSAKSVMDIYDQVKMRNPRIDRTYRALKFYKGLNLYVDTSYYHALYLKNCLKGTRRSLNMYLDFLTRLMENEEINKSYEKITYFFPVFSNRTSNIDDLLDGLKNLNVLSMINYFGFKEPEVLKKLANKNIVFIGENGYFTVNFNNFTRISLSRFKRNIFKLISNENIIDDDPDEDSIEDDSKSVKAASVEIIDKIEDKSGIKLTDISAINKSNINHLSMNDIIPNISIKDNTNAIMILSPNSTDVISEINNKGLKSKDIQVYYKPKV